MHAARLYLRAAICALFVASSIMGQQMMKVEVMRYDFENLTHLGKSFTAQGQSFWGWGISDWPDSAGFCAEGRRCWHAKGINWGMAMGLYWDPYIKTGTTYQAEFMVRNEADIGGRKYFEFSQNERGYNPGTVNANWPAGEWTKDSISWTTFSSFEPGGNSIMLNVALLHNEGGILTKNPSHGYLDDVVLYEVVPEASAPPEIWCHYISGCQQPRDTVVDAGEMAIFAVYAKGKAPLEYQWYMNGEAMEGETSRNLVIESAGAAENGAAFTCQISNEDGSITSDPATLTVEGVTGTAAPATVSSSRPLRVTVNGGTAVARLPGPVAWRMALYTLEGRLVRAESGFGTRAEIKLPRGECTFVSRLTAGTQTHTSLVKQ